MTVAVVIRLFSPKILTKQSPSLEIWPLSLAFLLF